MSKEEFDNFYHRVNCTKEIGVIDFVKPMIFMIPKTLDRLTVNKLVKDLFEACTFKDVKELWMTHFQMILTSFPEYEITSILEYISKNVGNLSVERIIINIDCKYYDHLKKLIESTNANKV